MSQFQSQFSKSRFTSRLNLPACANGRQVEFGNSTYNIPIFSNSPVHFTIAPCAADVVMTAYLAKYPVGFSIRVVQLSGVFLVLTVVYSNRSFVIDRNFISVSNL